MSDPAPPYVFCHPTEGASPVALGIVSTAAKREIRIADTTKALHISYFSASYY
jgi:hypothetical protein